MECNHEWKYDETDYDCPYAAQVICEKCHKYGEIDFEYCMTKQCYLISIDQVDKTKVYIIS